MPTTWHKLESEPNFYRHMLSKLHVNILFYPQVDEQNIYKFMNEKIDGWTK